MVGKRGIKKRVLLASFFFLGAILLCLSAWPSYTEDVARRLSEDSSRNSTHKCKSHSAIGFDLSVDNPSKVVRVMVGFILTFFCFLGLAVVCDEFFQPALEKISEVLRLSPDVAGATFLAAGSSAPELFTSFGDTFGPANNIGVGTIVGSAMFNILVIVALSAAAAGGTLQIDWRPVYRDVFFYCLSVFLFMIFAADEKVEMHEALIMVLMYFVYIMVMKVNQHLFAGCDAAWGIISDKSPNLLNKKAAVEMVTQKADSDSADGIGIEIKKEEHLAIGDGGGAKEMGNPIYSGEDTGRKLSISHVPAAEVEKKAEEEEDEDDGGRFDWPDDIGGQIYFVLAFPWLALFTISIPDVANPKWENWYAVGFGMSIVWIGVLCYIMVEAATQIGCELGVHPVVMGVLVLAIGTSVPDAIGSILAAKSGEADMAVANAIGSNVFDILLGLGLPWFCVTVSGTKPFVGVDVEAMTTSVIILLSTVVLFLATLTLSKWQMNARLGKILLVLYMIYIIYTISDAVVNPKKVPKK